MSQATVAKPVLGTQPGKKSGKRRSRLGESPYHGLLYITPWLIGFLVFTLYPIVASFYLSFTKYDLVSAPKFIGLDNYVRMFKDPVFRKALTVTFQYVIWEVPLKLAFSLFVAMILNMKLRGINFFRTAYYIPSILGSNVAIAVLWKFIFQTNGLVNQVLNLLGMPSVGWFGEQFPALITIVLLRVWEFGSTMVIFLAALKSLPQDVYEAASVDGCTKFRQFFRITIPLLSPTIFFNFVMQLIHAFQEFNAPYLITKGGPQKGTYLLPILIYENTFKYYKMGYAAAMSWILFIIIMIFTAFAFKGSKYWVFYSDDGKGAGEKDA
ncbi:carbohydrate ABC transporter permease [Marasmitruncus massiliensis]|uniref:carbohydrate ABC transporter permease n=1 Tax=Marasmitruncus massiliensis TaxID=1944642 RepID=UPI000C7CB4D7|nr:sugar ABC transporter permease [Marasmitruncus massiliensis]